MTALTALVVFVKRVTLFVLLAGSFVWLLKYRHRYAEDTFNDFALNIPESVVQNSSVELYQSFYFNETVSGWPEAWSGSPICITVMADEENIQTLKLFIESILSFG